MEHELRDRLRLAIAELPAREAEVFCLRYFEELSYLAIRRFLGPSGRQIRPVFQRFHHFT